MYSDWMLLNSCYWFIWEELLYTTPTWHRQNVIQTIMADPATNVFEDWADWVSHEEKKTVYLKKRLPTEVKKNCMNSMFEYCVNRGKATPNKFCSPSVLSDTFAWGWAGGRSIFIISLRDWKPFKPLFTKIVYPKRGQLRSNCIWNLKLFFSKFQGWSLIFQIWNDFKYIYKYQIKKIMCNNLWCSIMMMSVHHSVSIYSANAPLFTTFTCRTVCFLKINHCNNGMYSCVVYVVCRWW